jgi:hypothetical protein
MIPVTKVGTYRSRALHSNHMKGHVWEEYGSETLHAKPKVELQDPSDGGRGYYRPISLLSVWAHAPFMHNNAIGPELCGSPTDPNLELYRSPYVIKGTWRRMKNAPACWPFDPSVEGRYSLYEASMKQLLNPESRFPKITLIDEPVIIDGPSFGDDGSGFRLQIPAGIPAAFVGNLRHKELVRDLTWAKLNPQRLREEYTRRFGAVEGERIAATLQSILKELLVGIATDAEDVIREIGQRHLEFVRRLYSNSAAEVENEGHTFGQSLSEPDKKALVALLATF